MLWILFFFNGVIGTHQDAGFSINNPQLFREASNNIQYENFLGCLTLVRNSHFFSILKSNYGPLVLWKSSYQIQTTSQNFESIKGHSNSNRRLTDDAYHSYLIFSSDHKKPPFVAAHKESQSFLISNVPFFSVSSDNEGYSVNYVKVTGGDDTTTQSLSILEGIIYTFVTSGFSTEPFLPVILNGGVFGDWDGKTGHSGFLYRIFQEEYRLEVIPLPTPSVSVSPSPFACPDICSNFSLCFWPDSLFGDEPVRVCTERCYEVQASSPTWLCSNETQAASTPYLFLTGQFVDCTGCEYGSQSKSSSPTPSASVSLSASRSPLPTNCFACFYCHSPNEPCTEFCVWDNFSNLQYDVYSGVCVSEGNTDPFGTPQDDQSFHCSACNSSNFTSPSTSPSRTPLITLTSSSSRTISISPSKSPPESVLVKINDLGAIDTYLSLGGSLQHLQELLRSEDSWRRIYRRTVSNYGTVFYTEPAPEFVNSSSMWTKDGATYNSGVELVALRRRDGSDRWHRTLIHSGCRRLTTFERKSNNNRVPGNVDQTVHFAPNNLVPFRGEHLCETHDILGENHLQVLTLMYNTLSSSFYSPTVVFYSFFESGSLDLKAEFLPTPVITLRGRLRGVAVSDADGNGLQDIVVLQESELDSLQIMYTHKSAAGVLQQYVPVTLVNSGHASNLYGSIALCPFGQDQRPNLVFTDLNMNWKYLQNTHAGDEEVVITDPLCDLLLPQCIGKCSSIPFPRCICDNNKFGDGENDCTPSSAAVIKPIDIVGGTPVCAEEDLSSISFCQDKSLTCGIFDDQLEENFLLTGERPFEEGVYSLHCPTSPYNDQELLFEIRSGDCHFHFVGSPGGDGILVLTQEEVSVLMEDLLEGVSVNRNISGLFVENKVEICDNLYSLLPPSVACPAPWSNDIFKDSGMPWCQLTGIIEKQCFGGTLQCTGNEEGFFDCGFPEGPAPAAQAQLSCSNVPANLVVPSGSCEDVYSYCQYEGNTFLKEDKGCPEPFAWNSQECVLDQELTAYPPCQPHTELGCTPTACVTTDMYDSSVRVLPNPLRHPLIRHVHNYTSDVAYWDTNQVGKLDERQGNLTRSALFCSLLRTSASPLYVTEESCPYLIVDENTYIVNRTVECVRQDNNLYTCWSLTALHGSVQSMVDLRDYDSLCFVRTEPCIEPFDDAGPLEQLGSCAWTVDDLSAVTPILRADRRTEGSLELYCDSQEMTQVSCSLLDAVRGYNCSVSHSEDPLWWCVLPLVNTESVCSSLVKKCRLGLQGWAQRLADVGEYMVTDPRTFRSLCQNCSAASGILCPFSAPWVCDHHFCESTALTGGVCSLGSVATNKDTEVDRVCGPSVPIKCSYTDEDSFVCAHRGQAGDRERYYHCSVPAAVVLGRDFCSSFQEWCLYENHHGTGLSSGCLAESHQNPIHLEAGTLPGAYCLVPTDNSSTLWWPVVSSDFWCEEPVLPQVLRDRLSLESLNQSWKLSFPCGETELICQSLGEGACEDFVCKTRCQLGVPPELNCYETQQPLLRGTDGLGEGCTLPLGALLQERNLRTCENLLEHCSMRCASSGVQETAVDSTYCNAQVIPTEEFMCYGEPLVCTLEFPDGFSHFYRCVQGESVSRFTMDCLIERRLVENQADVCTALTELCREDIVCGEGYLRGEKEQILCDIEPVSSNWQTGGEGSGCSCDFHWAPTEIAAGSMPVSLIDTQVYNRLGTDEILTLVAPAPEDLLLSNLEPSILQKADIVQLITEEHLEGSIGQQTYGLSCRNRGYFSVPEFFLSILKPVFPDFDDRYKLLIHFLRGTDPFLYSLGTSVLTQQLQTILSPYLFNASLGGGFPGENLGALEIITGASFRATRMGESSLPSLQPWKLYWCLEAAGSEPDDIEENQEQQYLSSMGVVRPVCSVRPGKYLPLCTIQCSVGWKLDVHTAVGKCFTNEGSTCVLGVTDPFASDREANPPSCPSNLYPEYTSLPVKSPKKFHTESLQLKDMCYQHPECAGVVFAYGGVFFSRRKLNYPLSGLQRLLSSKYDHQHKLSGEQKYFLHPVPVSRLNEEGEALLYQELEEETSAYSLTQVAAQKNCTNFHFDWRFPFQTQHEGHPLHTHAFLGFFALKALKERLRFWFTEKLENSNDTSAFLGAWENVETLSQLRGFLSVNHPVSLDYEIDPSYETARSALILAHFQEWALQFQSILGTKEVSIKELAEEQSILPCFLDDDSACDWQPDTQFYGERVRELTLENISSYWMMSGADSDWLSRSEAGIPQKSGPLFRMEKITSLGMTYSSYDALSNYWPSFGSVMPETNFLNGKLSVLKLLRKEEIDYVGHWGLQQLHALPPTAEKISFVSLEDLVAYHSWQNWEGVLRHAFHGFNRLSSSPDSCPEIQNPLWEFLPVEPHQCIQPLCPVPLVADVDWFSLDPSLKDQANAGIYPNPGLKTLPRNERNGFPCSMQGWCDTTKPLGEPSLAEIFRGSCRCFPDFEVAETTDFGKTTVNQYGQRKVFSSLRSDSCQIDIRGTCSVSLLEDLTETCGNKGVCVVDFEAGFQKGACDCGNFPSVVQTSEANLLTEEGFVVRKTCNEFSKGDKNYCLNLDTAFVANGYSSPASRYPEQCLIPPEGCVQNNADAWDSQFQRLSRGTYERQESFGCTLPRRNALGVEDGDCVKQGEKYSCRCREGRYGEYCEHVTLAGRCFDAAITDPLAYNCVWNSYLHHFEPIGVNIPAERDVDLYPSFLCGGVACSGQGVCVHNKMLETEELRGQLAPIPGFRYDLSWQELISSVPEFRINMHTEYVANSTLLGRALEQYCVCNEGRGGQFCQERLCTDPECYVQELQYCAGIGEQSSALVCHCPRVKQDSNSCWRPTKSLSPEKCQCLQGNIFFCDTEGDFKLVKIKDGPPVVADCVCKNPNQTISREGTCVDKNFV